MSCSDAVDCDAEQMEKDMCRRWRRYDSIGRQQSNGEPRERARSQSGSGYKCKMAVNPALSKLIGSNGEIEGRVRRRNGDITLDLSPAKSRAKSSGPSGGSGICSLSSCCKQSSQQDQQQQRHLEKQRIIRKMDYLECELDAVARKIKKETKKKIQRQKEAEEEAAAAAEEEEDEAAEGEDGGGGDDGDGGDDGGDGGDDGGGDDEEEEERTGKFKEVTKTVHKEKLVNDDGEEETVTITTKEQQEGTGKKQTKVVTTTEEHKTKNGGGYTIITTEKTVKGGKHNEYKMVRTEKIKSRDDSAPKNPQVPKTKHREVTQETTYDEEGKRHEVKTDTTETVKGTKQKVKKIVETKDEAEGGNIVYEKTITKTKEQPD